MEAERNPRTGLKKYMIAFILFCFIGSIAINVLPTSVYAKTTVKLNKNTITLCKGNSYKLKVSGTSNKVKWESNNKKVATVSTKGKVIAKKVGSTKIKATIGKVNLECTVKVKTHSYTTASCTEEKICTRCNKETGIYGDHKYEKTVVEASKSQAGYTLYTCTICGDTYEDHYTDYQVTEAKANEDMLALKTEYPEGLSWTNDNYYPWNGGIFSGGYGCAGFAFALSDAAFGYLPARKHNNLDEIKVGDILRINHDSHSVIVIERYDNYVVVAEGNYNSSIHWGRTFTYNELAKSCDYIMTRYPITK